MVQKAIARAYAWYLELGTGGKLLIPASSDIAAASRKDVIFRRWSRMEPATIHVRLSSLKRWRSWLEHHPEWVDEPWIEPSVPCFAAVLIAGRRAGAYGGSRLHREPDMVQPCAGDRLSVQ